MNAESIAAFAAAAFGGSVPVTPVRPRLFQVEVPAYFGDRDGIQVYVRALDDGRAHVTDLGHTLMRLSYFEPLTDRMSRALEDLAQRHGFRIESGSVCADVDRPELLGAMFGLVQIESEAEVAIVTRREAAERSQRFHDTVRSALREAMGGLVDFDVPDSDQAEPLFTLDAVVHGRRDLAIAIVANNLDAETAVGGKPHVSPRLKNPHFMSVIRDVSSLRKASQRRLLQEYPIAIPSFDDEKTFREKVREFSDAA